jgi:adenylosuccinate lyase
VTPERLAAFVDGLDLGAEAKERLRRLRPDSYTGLAEQLVAHLDEPSGQSG